MASTGLLVVTNPIKLGWLLQMVQNQVRKTLYIQLFPGWNRFDVCISPSSNDRSKYISQLSHLVTGLYSQATALCHHLDVRVLLSQTKDCLNTSSKDIDRQIDVVFYDQSTNTEELNKFVSRCFGIEANKSNCTILALDVKEGDKKEGDVSNSIVQAVKDCQARDTDCQFNHVVLGGTFDRLHNGHKELLSQAIIRCKSKLTVGVTDANMVKSKLLHELIEPCNRRIEYVKKFLMDVDQSLDYNVVPISDPFGPTKDDPTMDMIVVSAETLRGGEKVNQIRLEKNMGKLELHCVELLEDLIPSDLKDPEGEDWKISSSSARARLLGTLLKHPQARPDLPTRPYVIGLTGGIASGKSAIGDRLERLGAGVINCDLLGHEVYLPGTRGHDLVVQEFGLEILDSEGHVDRKKLGSIVFNDQSRLVKLDEMLWPLMMEMVEERLNIMRDAGISVAVVEAAVLTRAGWDKRCHEVWSVIVPPNEAIRRLQERNKLSEEESKVRLAAQPANEEHVAVANVVFSPSWSPEHTQRQVQRAWQQLQSRIQSVSHL